ncbi:MAG: rod shape-determining protein [Candidatus Zambryskibacteria bacterium RIFCSPLOWO2_01_FULL_39_39]|uniref:Cell shape-determining protein MreB n=1 Tax=Candidatus Zambryskibacteria bacterium RIFCSPLOWO2_01_FULL_39_39 TaxID=1802758 RepID=A0A1G2TXQ5_9BACT|nr:MAG: Cell shape determining protein, MreB/Mrl family [Parcubacteria group bacterium GW2011_GWA1_38_7]OHA86579.1 MAG: rod shape-determining protein [Candidatus Zambryskibacteria bacterium RIFCSPHIGHO2_01_FULL_39_63]OHA94252.1 MAG: rod shape-determining protein [Candidatus Zambryskibacteria bacterium RIFCSPHIGHO2_02_FULL_39_19]OHA98481.1 MAG: rod shape-determining protein [Candidatus Zambryskibacteria bacterium RIFCSPHIGHO2_12_FULL_39_21]OHB01400.1 MAG: rod shape-determining protein [Candidatu
MFKEKLEEWKRVLRNDIGIDLGTANMLVYVRDKGIILNEPSVVAVNQKTGQVVAVGTEAKNMLGRTPPHIVAVRPIVDGVISDFEVTEEMLHYLLNKAQSVSKKILGPRVVVGVPSGITNVETRAVRDATKNAGASEVHIVEEPMAAAIGMHLPINEPTGNMVIDMGGGTADIAVISLSGVISSKNVRIAGDKLSNDIAAYIRSEFKIVIGEKTAENIKIAICSLLPEEDPLETEARGRDLITGLPREVVVTDSDMRDAVSHSIERLVEATKEVLEITPPEILSDIMHRGIHLAGGGALIKGFAKVLEREIKIPVYIADDPLTCVVRGTGIILEKLEQFREVLIADENDISNKTH